MAEVTLAFLGIVGIIDSTINCVERIYILVQNIKNVPDKIVEVQAKLVVSKEIVAKLREYLTTKELGQTVQDGLMIHVRVLNQVVTKCEYYVKRSQNNLMGTMWFASIGRIKLCNEIQKLDDWNNLVGNLVSSLMALDISALAATVDQHTKSSEDLYIFMKIIAKAILVRDRKKIPPNDNDLQEIVFDEREIENYNISNNQLRGFGRWHGTEVMIEKINMNEIPDAKRSRQRVDLRRLALILKQFRPSHNILEFRGIAEPDSDDILLISDGSFKETLKDIISGCSSPMAVDCKKIVTGVADGFTYLHSAGILHKDLRSSNIFIDLANKRPLISGFTLSRKVDWDSVRHREDSLDARIWQAPERFGIGFPKYVPACDIYSYGILLLEVGCWEVLSEKQFPDQDLEIMQQTKEELANVCDKMAITDYGGLIRSCISRIANDRPSITDIREKLEE